MTIILMYPYLCGRCSKKQKEYQIVILNEIRHFWKTFDLNIINTHNSIWFIVVIGNDILQGMKLLFCTKYFTTYVHVIYDNLYDKHKARCFRINIAEDA